MSHPFQEALPVLEKLEKHGYKAYFVGGAVRDYILDRPLGDIDIATNAIPEQVMSIFEKTVPIGIEHGTVLVRYQKKSYEVTTFRVDGEYEDFRHPDRVEFVRDIKEDLARRDFTINAIAMDKEGNLVDPFGGRKDLENQVLRTVRNPYDRFQEDPLRIMRAVRFISQLGFQLNSETEEAMKHQGPLLEKIAVERIAAEMEKLLKGTYVHKALQVIKGNLIHSYLPLFKEEKGLIDACIKTVRNPVRELYEGIALFHILDNRFSIQNWCKRWKLSNKIKNKSQQLADTYYCYQKKGLDNTCIYLLDEDVVPSFSNLVKLIEHHDVKEKELKERFKQLPIHSLRDLEVDGQMLKQWFPDRKPGPWMKNILTQLEINVLKGEVKNHKESLKEWVLNWSQREEN